MDILVGLLILIVGGSLLLSGLRVFFAMLPLVGFIVGFGLGATVISGWLGDGFLATTTGWIVGIIVGFVFSFFSYMYWYIGALLSAGASGALLLSGIFSAFGVNSGWVLTILAFVGAVVFIAGAMMLNLPVYVVLINTAIVGAYAVITGVLLIFDRKDLENFDWGVARTITNDSWFWWLVLIVLVVIGISSQMKLIARVALPQEKWVKAEPNQQV